MMAAQATTVRATPQRDAFLEGSWHWFKYLGLTLLFGVIWAALYCFWPFAGSFMGLPELPWQNFAFQAPVFSISSLLLALIVRFPMKRTGWASIALSFVYPILMNQMFLFLLLGWAYLTDPRSVSDEAAAWGPVIGMISAIQGFYLLFPISLIYLLILRKTIPKRENIRYTGRIEFREGTKNSEFFK
jgi:hypothetical protein